MGVDEKDSSKDVELEQMSPKEITILWATYYLGFEWAERIIDKYELLKNLDEMQNGKT